MGSPSVRQADDFLLRKLSRRKPYHMRAAGVDALAALAPDETQTQVPTRLLSLSAAECFAYYATGRWIINGSAAEGTWAGKST